MTTEEKYDDALENAVERLKTLEYFLEHAKHALDNEDISLATELAETMEDRAESFYKAMLELQEADEYLQEERESK